MDVAFFLATAVGVIALNHAKQEKTILSSRIPRDTLSLRYFLPGSTLFVVNKCNEPIGSDRESQRWCRATYILVMHEPPHLFYEPKDLAHTTVLLLKTTGSDGDAVLQLPGGPLRKH